MFRHSQISCNLYIHTLHHKKYAHDSLSCGLQMFDTQSPFSNITINHLSIPKFGDGSKISYDTLYRGACDNLSMLWLELIHVSKMGLS